MSFWGATGTPVLDCDFKLVLISLSYRPETEVDFLEVRVARCPFIIVDPEVCAEASDQETQPWKSQEIRSI